MNSILRFQKVSGSSRNLLSQIQKTSFCCYKKLPFSSVPVLRRIRSPSLSVSRNFWETFPGTRPLVHIKDNLDPENHDIVFRAKLFNYAFYGQLVTMCTFVTQAIFGAYYAYQAVLYNIGPSVTEIGGLPVTYDFVSITILTIFTLQYAMVYQISQNTLLRVYHKTDTDEYVFVSLSVNPFQSRLTYCKPGDMVPLQRKGIFKFFGNYEIEDRNFYFRYENFFDLSHFNRLLSEPIRE